MTRLVTSLRGTFVAFVLLAAFAGPSWALSAAEVENVVAVLKEIGPEIGDLAYDETAADDWFEEDEAGEGRIASAGFTAQSWRTAVDATMKGFYAALPQREIDAAFEGADAFETRADFSAEQKEAMRQLVSEWRVRMYEWRDEGADDAAVVEPYVNDIRVLLDVR